MFSIYIRHYKPTRGSSASGVIENETLMMSIPNETLDEDRLIDPKVKNEMGKAGSFEFGIDESNKWYSSFIQMKTLMRVVYNNETIFYGRVLAIDTDIWGTRKVHCEGALAFLLDTLSMPTKENERVAISMETYVKDLIDNHNSLVRDEPAKQFRYGEIPGYYTSASSAEMRPVGETRKFGSGSWTSTLNCLEDLTSKYGGYWRARYNNGYLYLDWLLNYFDQTVCNQPLKVADNIVDMSNTVDVNGIFTVLIPEGTKNGKPLYLDETPKTIVKIPNTPKPKQPVGPIPPDTLLIE